MSGYYHLEDPNNEFGLTPIPEEEFVNAIFLIAKSHGLQITDAMILNEVWKKNKSSKQSIGKTYFYIDGTNLFAGQNELFGPHKHLSFKFIIQEIQKLTSIDKIFFYASFMNQINRTKFAVEKKSLLAAEALFYREVRNTKNVNFYRGHRSPTSGKEKGVDVHLSVDIVKDVFSGNCNQVIIMTGDADLIYPLEIVKMLKIPTTAFFLPNRFSLEMAYKADQAFVFNFINKFKVDRKLPKQLKIIPIKKPRMVNIRGR